MPFLRSLKLQGLLSFPPNAEPIELGSLNVLIGPNGSGKSNVIEAIGLLNWLPTSFSAGIRAGGGIEEWLWKGAIPATAAEIDVLIDGWPASELLRYHLQFSGRANRSDVMREMIGVERGNLIPGQFYLNLPDRKQIEIREKTGGNTWRDVELERELVKTGESIFSQRKAPDLYPELTWIGEKFHAIWMFRDWNFGRENAIRRPQRVDLPSDSLLPDSSNLGLILNELDHAGLLPELNAILKRFLPRFERITLRVTGGSLEVFVHEQQLKSPIPAARLSDGTLRFIALLSILLAPSPPPLVCIDEPELGLHPDAIVLLADVLLEAQQRMQLVVTTHSDALVSALTEHVDSVLVCEYHQGTTIQRLEAAKLQTWLEDYRLGEIWRIGALGGNP